jgi:hypothetical protein
MQEEYNMNKVKLEKLELIPDYLPQNLEILKSLKGTKVINILRLSGIPDDEHLRTHEPILIDTDRIGRILIYNDEGMNNLVIISNKDQSIIVENLIKNSFELTKIVADKSSRLLNDYDFNLQIKDINILTCEHEFLGWNLMSGIELVFADGKKIAIGTGITEWEIQGIWIIDSLEIDSKWNHINIENCDSYYGLNLQDEEIKMKK